MRTAVFASVVCASAAAFANPSPGKAWVTEGFEAFRRGTFGNAGQNLYVSRAGVLQRIYQYDLDKNGCFDLVFANCQNHWIWLNAADGFKAENRIAVRTRSASSVHAMDGMVVFGQCAADGMYTNDALLFSF